MALFLLKHVQLLLQSLLLILKHALFELVNFLLLVLVNVVEL